MTKQELKEFVKTHKKEIILGAGAIVVGGTIFVVTKRKPSLPSEMDENTKAYLEMLKSVNKAMKGSEYFLRMVPEDFKEICGRDEMIVRDGSGNFLNVTGGILFGI